jgi:exopolysaccharide production protein ExoY
MGQNYPLDRGFMGFLSTQSQLGYAPEEFDTTTAIYEDAVPRLSLVPAASRMQSWQYQVVKRGVDLVCATLMITACVVPGLMIAAAIALTSKGSIFYSEVRIGQGGRPFRIWKFRSMRTKMTRYSQIEAVPHLEFLSRWRTDKDCHDPRITPVGRFIRRWSLDELPQLINVFRGDMSLVGPRPVVRAELPLYEHLLDFYLAATPGLSGLWQVSGRSNVNFSTRAKLDASYVRSWSLRSDLVILARTLPAVLRRVGAR